MKRIFLFFAPYYHKYREQFWYLIVGGITTVVNFSIYYLLYEICGLHYLFINWIAWAAAVVFAFFPNRILVFRSQQKLHIGRQFISFASSRLTTFLIEEGLLWLSVDILHGSKTWMKLWVSVLVVVLNYVLSKIFVFRENASGADRNRQKKT